MIFLFDFTNLLLDTFLRHLQSYDKAQQIQL